MLYNPRGDFWISRDITYDLAGFAEEGKKML